MAKLSDVGLLKVGDTIQMSGAIFSGEGKTYLCFFPEDRDLGHPVEPLDMGVEDWQAFLRQTDVLETEVLAKSSDGTLAKAILRKSARQVDQVVTWRVFRRDGYACRYCGRDDVPLTVDHLVCWEDGGPTTEANMVSACKKCNKVRGNAPYAEWLRHPRYLEVSKGLDPAGRRRNLDVEPTLASVPRHVHARSR